MINLRWLKLADGSKCKVAPLQVAVHGFDVDVESVCQLPGGRTCDVVSHELVDRLGIKAWEAPNDWRSAAGEGRLPCWFRIWGSRGSLTCGNVIQEERGEAHHESPGQTGYLALRLSGWGEVLEE